LLEGIRVLDLTHFLAGPYCTLVMADLGADVVRVEDPEHPDEARSMPPHFQDGESLYYLSLNWGKRSVALRLGDPADRERMYGLAGWADVVVDNFRPGVMRKLGFDHQALAARNPRLVTCSITGFGEDGPYSGRPGYDYTIQALAGIQSLTADPPVRPGIAYADHTGGLTAVVALLAALLERERTGRGRHLDVGLLDVQLSMLTYLAGYALNAGEVPRPVAGGGHPVLVPTQNFATADGWVSFFVGNDPMWRRARAALEAPDLEDPRFDTIAGRAQHKAEVLDLVGRRLRGDTTAAWVAKLEAAGVPCAPVNGVDQALADPQALARGMVVEDAHPGYGRYRHVAGPLPRLRNLENRPAPRLGEHTQEVLREAGVL
jgi:crotonobetainyl-CoA:carnitine CoA-transferase CaiB-like acyl-CoA transferase